MMKIDDLRTEIDELNRELAQWTDRPPLRLPYQTGGAEEDTLFLYGIVGGKDVGKTSLINQLAGARISIDTDILDEGTRRAVAYCHREDLVPLKKRLTATIERRVEYITHDRNILKNVVLVDFPDYDSRFQAHRDDVRILGRFLQGLVWVITPRKYGDHEFIDQLEAVAQSHEYYLIVLNKTDQLEGRVNLESARREILGYLKEECTKRGVPAPTGDRLLMVSALNPNRYEYPRLYERLIRRHSPDEILRAKADNLRTEFHKNLEKIRGYYLIPQRIAELDDVLEEIAAALNEQFDEEYFQTVWQRILALTPVQHRIGQGLFYQRVRHWPVLRLLFHPLAGLIAFFGSRLSSFSREEKVTESSRDLLRRQGQSASARLQAIRAGVEESHPNLIADLDGAPDYATPLEKNFRRLLDDYEERVIRRVAASIPVPGRMRRSLAYFPLIWFPFLQPLLVNVFSMDESLTPLGSLQELFAILLSLAGAGSLLQSAVFLIVFYTAWLVILYARGARRAWLAGEEEFRGLWWEEFIPMMLDLLSHPFAALRASWLDKQNQIDGIQTEISTELQRIQQVK